MEWDLDPSVAEQLRLDAKRSSRVRIINNINNKEKNDDLAALNPTSTARPIPGEYLLIDLQGELVFPNENDDELSGLAQLGASTQNNNDGVLTPIIFDDEENSNKRFSVGRIDEDDVKAAKTKAILKMGTLLVEGERMKIAGPPLILIDRTLQKILGTKATSNKNQRDDDGSDNRQNKKEDAASVAVTGDGNDDDNETVKEMANKNGLPSQFFPSESSFSHKHHCSKTTRRQRQDDENDEEELSEEERLIRQAEQDDELMQDLLNEEYRQDQSAEKIDEKSFAPRYHQWKIGGSEISEEKLLESLDASCARQDFTDQDNNNHDGEKNDSYTVKGVLAQKYLFKAKPSRQTKIA